MLLQTILTFVEETKTPNLWRRTMIGVTQLPSNYREHLYKW